MISFLYLKLWPLVFAPLLIMVILPNKKKNLGSALKIPFLDDLKNLGNSTSKGVKSSSKAIYIWLIWLCLVLSLMRPVTKSEPINIDSKARNVVMVMDISPSMLETDFIYNNLRYDRLSGVKKIAADFIEDRAGDKVGLVLFATRAYLQSPITFDTNSVIEVLTNMQAGMAGESTAIGDALGLGLKYLKDEPDIDKKIMILLTDGDNNDGYLSVAQAVELAQKEGVKIYTIGVGTDNSLISAIFGSQGFDEKALKQIADLTKGRYFKATSGAELKRIYQEIDKLEPIEDDTKKVVLIKDLFFIPALFAFALSALFFFLYKRRRV